MVRTSEIETVTTTPAQIAAQEIGPSLYGVTTVVDMISSPGEFNCIRNDAYTWPEAG
jgi:hypothetical protein